MLERAEQERWSVRELRQKVVLRRRAGGERRGRPSVQSEVRSFVVLRQRIRQIDEAIATIEKIAPLTIELQTSLGVLAAELERHRGRVVVLASGEDTGSGERPPRLRSAG